MIALVRVNQCWWKKVKFPFQTLSASSPLKQGEVADDCCWKQKIVVGQEGLRITKKKQRKLSLNLALRKLRTWTIL